MLPIYSTRKRNIVDPSLSFLSDLSYLFYLETHEPFSFALLKVKLRKAYKLTLSEFSAIYRGYKLQLRRVSQ
jgi:hypothetical protein